MAVRVLLVDDEEGIRKVLKIYLQDVGYKVVTADNGKKAVEIIDAESFDIVLTDIRMPGMDGISLLKHIKKNSPDTEVIMITGHGDFKLAIESLKLDAVDFISKPIDNDILEIALKRAHDRIETRKKILTYTKNLEVLVEEKTRKLAESKKRYIQLFNESPSYLTIQDKNLNIIETNRIFKEHFNYKEGMACYEVYKGRNSPCPGCPVIKTFDDNQSHTAEMDVVLKDSSVRNIFIQTSAITDSKGKVKHVMEMSTDVTMIRELQDHLASLGLHIGSVSHGLKQVLTGLDGGSYLIESGLGKNDNQQISEGWEIVKEKLSKTRQMVLDILFHTKKREPDRSEVLLQELIKEIVSSIKPKADQENVNLKIDFPHNNIVLFIDKMAVLAALSSILENAVDACVSKNIKGEISFLTQIKDPDIIFSIRDNGKGLDENKKDKIFDLFFSDKGNKGTGLGLFIASRSIKQHGGTIKVTSQLNQYTQFIVTLPLK
ncbi:MAG: response regulator [Desulfobacula sp.]|jgi:FixJ family two-component response regulator/nitrogen-specific signal transduction histidine kinase|nr:response regulator [Desulfobacula sp.]